MIFNIPTKINFGVECLKTFSLDIKYSNMALITSKTFEKNNYVYETIIKYFRNISTSLQIITIESSEPTTENIDYIYNELNKNTNAIIAIGGGSVLDTTKFLSVMFYSNASSINYDFNQMKITNALPLYLIPTTAGSGSEVTPYAVATNSNTNRKFTIYSKFLFPKESYIDPILLKSLPKEKLINSSLDAFIHSLESILNKNKNILIYDFAITSLRNIYNILNKNLKNLTIFDYEKLSLASLYGGICIANNRTGMIHTFSVALSEYSNELHGLLNAKILSNILKYNLDSYEGKLASIISLVTNNIITKDEEAYDIINNFINSAIINKKINFSKKPSIEHIVNRVLQDKGLHNVNPKKYSKKDLINITKELLCQE